MISLEVNGQPYDNFKSLSFSRSLETLCGQFSFVATSEQISQFPIKRRSSARVLVNGFPLITGFIDAQTPFISSGENVVNIQGRDKTEDFLDSTLNAGSVELSAGVTLKEVIERTVAALGQTLTVIDAVGTLEPFNEAEDLVSAEAGQNAFKFVEMFCRKRQVLLTTDGNGNIVITRSSKEFINYRILNRKGDDEATQFNNVKTATVSYDDSKRFNKYIVVSQQNPIALNFSGDVDLGDVVSVESDVVIDKEIREGRVLHIVAEKSSAPENAKKRAQWEANFRKAQSRKYRSTTDDFLIPGTTQPFPINRLVNVIDDDNDISAEMLIESIGLSLIVSGGTETSFSLVERDAYTLKLEEPITQKTSNLLGFNL